MNTTSKNDGVPRMPSKKGVFDQFVDTVYWTCYGVIALLLVMSFNAEIDSRTVARSTPESAVVTRLFRAETKDHPLYVSVRFPSADGSQALCDVDIRLEHRPDGIEVGKQIRIVRTSRRCGEPLLVDYLASVDAPFRFAMGVFCLGSVLFLLRRHRAGNRERAA